MSLKDIKDSCMRDVMAKFLKLTGNISWTCDIILDHVQDDLFSGLIRARSSRRPLLLAFGIVPFFPFLFPVPFKKRFRLESKA